MSTSGSHELAQASSNKAVVLDQLCHFQEVLFCEPNLTFWVSVFHLYN